MTPRAVLRLILVSLLWTMAASLSKGGAQTLAGSSSLQFVPLARPCRAVDTRFVGGPIASGTSQTFDPTGGDCNIPSQGTGPIAYAMNITVVPHGSLNYLTVWPAGEAQPVASILNSPDGRVKANAAILSGGQGGQISVYAGGASTDVILDVSGYFIASSTEYLYVPVTPCRAVDTRLSNGAGLGSPSLAGDQQRSFSLAASSCHLPASLFANGGAVALNATAVPVAGHPISYVTIWGTSTTDTQVPLISALNAPTGTVVANAAITSINPGTSGSVSVYSSDNTDLIFDITGYFTPANQTPSALSLYPLTPCRVLDTRLSSGEFQGQIKVPFTSGNSCSLPGTAQAFAVNATVIPRADLGYLALWPDGLPQPLVSTLNAEDGSVTSNLAILGTSNGSVDAFASDPSQLILDVSSYFAPATGFTLAGQPSSFIVQPGATASFSLLASGMSGFSNTVHATLTPTAGFTVTPSSVDLAPGTAQLIKVSATSDALNGSISIQANADGFSQTMNEAVDVGPNFGIENMSGVLQANGFTNGYFDVGGNPAFSANVNAQITGFPPGLLLGSFLGNPYGVSPVSSTTLSLYATCPGSSAPPACQGSYYQIIWDGAAAGTYPLTLTATSGTITHSELLSITVTPPTFQLSVSPANGTVSKSRGNVPLAVAVSGYAAGTPDMQIHVENLPPGVLVSPLQFSGSTTLSVSAGSSAIPGTYTVGLSGYNLIDRGNGYNPSTYPGTTAGTQFTVTVTP